MKRNKAFWWIIAVGVGLRLVLWCFQAVAFGDDGAWYATLGVNLVDHGTYSMDKFVAPGVPLRPSAHYLPLWPAVLAVFYWISGSFAAMQYMAGLFNIALCLGGALLMALVLRSEPFGFNRRQIAVSAAIFMFLPESITYSLCTMPDMLAIFLMLLSLKFFFKALYGSRICFAGLAAALLAAIYAKQICIPFAISLIAAIPVLSKGGKLKSVMVAAVCATVVIAGLSPWIARNKMAFGTAGLHTIPGTNMFYTNWGRFAAQLPGNECRKEKQAMENFMSEISKYDDMKISQLQFDYAKDRLMANIGRYAVYTLKTHPRLYGGTGTVALLRYLGAERVCEALDCMWGSGKSKGCETPEPEIPYSSWEKAVGVLLQIVAWSILLAAYVIAGVGLVRGFSRAKRIEDGASRLSAFIAYLCPLLCLAMFAFVLGPNVTTRYRFIMTPFFAMLAGYAVKSANGRDCENLGNVAKFGKVKRA